LIVVLLGALLASGSALAASGGAGVGVGPPPSAHRPAKAPSGIPFDGRGMWIWVLGNSAHGNLGSIVSEARQYGVSTLYIKSGDGTGAWSQFNASMVSTLHSYGLHVCAWQYVYGKHPITEAYVGAAAVKDGADCLLIDAESEYEGRYVQAQAYMQRLRTLIGQRFPVALAGFPYIDYHRAFPYSVFLGPGGAQYNVPQMYWKDIGTTVDAVFAHTYMFNTLYQRPIFPLGQVYNHPPAGQILRFRQLSRAYGAPGVSWWDWQQAPTGAWQALAQAVGPLSGFTPYTDYATLGSGALGDVVVWAQEHLVSAGEPLTIDGAFGPQTQAAVETFQSAHGLTPSGLIDTLTWQALLRYQPAHVTWVIRKQRLTATTAGANVTLVPRSASLRARRYEIPRSFGAGRPPARK
jgi:hypothetical protein